MNSLILPYGSWPTPITSEVVVAKAVRLGEAQVDRGEVIWAEGRPAEGGRYALVRRGADGTLTDLLDATTNVRTAVHEYGGAAWWVRDGIVWYALWEDQRLYRRDPDTGRSTPLTPEPETPRADRYADGDVSPDGAWIACVREHHPREGGAAEVRNEIVRLHAHEPSEPQVLVSGPDFVSNPRWSPDGRRLCWVEWDHPDMPWDSTRLCVAELDGGRGVTASQVAVGAPEESVMEPQWLPDGSLLFISDHTGWWNLYRWDSRDGTVEPMTELEAEIGLPPWILGISRYGVLADGRIVFARSQGGFDGLAVRLSDGRVQDLDTPFTSIHSVQAADEDAVVAVAASPQAEAAVVRISLARDGAVEDIQTLRVSRDLRELGVERDLISMPQAIDLPSENGRTVHGILYGPTNPHAAGPEGELPPLLVHVHGGPTAAEIPELDLDVQYWTSRGFAVVTVNYGGSTGYGRQYRDLLRDAWGRVDVEDCISVARGLADQGRVDPARMAIRGGSAGGFTTLAALARVDTPFAAGADYFGVADLEALATDTHKFESRYLDRLVAPYPEGREVYRERSPIEHVNDFERPLIVLQGLEDAVVPPNQATMVVDALVAKGVPVAYLAFEGEQHGFRRAENIRRALDGELSFYAQIFGFELPVQEGIEPIEIR